MYNINSHINVIFFLQKTTGRSRERSASSYGFWWFWPTVLRIEILKLFWFFFILIQVDRILNCKCGKEMGIFNIPLCLACGHTLCTECFEEIKIDGFKSLEITCPECCNKFNYFYGSVPTNLDALRNAKRIQNLIKDKTTYLN